MSGIKPFTADAVERIGESSEYNAAKILKTAYVLLDKAAGATDVVAIDAAFVAKHRDTVHETVERGGAVSIEKAKTTDLQKKVAGEGT